VGKTLRRIRKAKGIESGGARRACRPESRICQQDRGRSVRSAIEHDQRTGQGARREAGEALRM